MNKEVEDKKGLEKEPVKKKSVKKASEDEVLNKNSIEINPKMNEATSRTVVLGWGRMNPITSGHEILVNKIKEVARANKATPIIYISHSQDAKKNPLSYDDKVMLAKRAFGNIIQKSNSKTIIQIMKELEDRFDKVILVAGDDRVGEFDKLLKKYNGADYNVKEIQVVSAGKRADPDSDDAKDMSAANMSASVMRKLASQGDIDAFKKGLPKGLQSDYKEVYDMVRGGMKIAEMMEEDEALTEALSVTQRRNRSLVMRKYRVKIDAARKRLSKKPATMEKLKVRARKAAINILRRRLAGKKGENYANLTPSEKSMVDQRVEKRKGAIAKIATRLLPTIRRADLQKLSGASASKSSDNSTKRESFDADFENFLEESTINEEFELLFESEDDAKDTTSEMKKSVYTKRYHQMYTKEGSIKLDKRFRAFRTKKLEEGQVLDAVKEKHKDEKEAMVKRHSTEKTTAKIRDIRAKVQEEFDTDAALLRFIEETTNDIYDSITLDEEKSNEGLKDKAEKSGISLAILKKVYDRGMGAYQTSHRPGTTPQQWAFARVNSFITGGKTRTTADADLWAKHSGKKSVEEGAKPGLWANIRKRREAGLPRLKPGQDGYPKTLDIKEAVTKKSSNEHDIDSLQKHFGPSVAYDAASHGPAMMKRKDVSGKSHTLIKQPNGKYKSLIDEAGGAGDEGTNELAKKYKKDTPGQSVTEGYICPGCEADPCICDDSHGFVNEEVSQQQIGDLEKFADRLLAKFKIDVEFTRHFADRMNDDRNNPPITVGELQKVFKKIASNKGAEVRQNPDIEAVLKDIQSDLNLPIVINYDKNKDEFEVVNKTIMRKKNFGTTSKVIKI